MYVMDSLDTLFFVYSIRIIQKKFSVWHNIVIVSFWSHTILQTDNHKKNIFVKNFFLRFMFFIVIVYCVKNALWQPIFFGGTSVLIDKSYLIQRKATTFTLNPQSSKGV